MNSREKLKKALNHEPGPIPLDFGGTAVTGMHAMVVEQLRDYYGLEKRPVRIWDPYQMLGAIDDDLRNVLGIDVVALAPARTIFGFPLENWKEWKTPWGQDVLVPGKFTVTEKNNGIYIYPEGDTSARPSGHMPVGGYFFDTIIRQEPIDDNTLDPADNLEEFGPISEKVLGHFQRGADAAYATGLGTVSSMPGTAFGDIALVPAPFLKNPKGIRDIAEWYISTAIRQDYVHAIFEKQAEYAIENLAKIKKRTGDKIDVAFLCGTDFGTQHGTFCSVESFNRLWAPYYKKLNNWIHEHTSWKTFKHSCGSVINFIDSFIDCGFDILNPVQCSANNMDPQNLKKKFGDRIVFWGGGVDTQNLLPFGSPGDVRKQVLERCRIFSVNGGFVFNAIHNVQANTPIKNVVAMLDAIKEINK